MKPKHQRAIKILLYIAIIAAGTFMLLFGLKDSMVFFYNPTELIAKADDLRKKNKTIRIGGMVKKGSIKRDKKQRTNITFIITDFENEIKVSYRGITPDLFKEGSGAVAQGKMDFKNNIFQASKILAKHDENYMPPNMVTKNKENNKTENKTKK